MAFSQSVIAHKAVATAIWALSVLSLFGGIYMVTKQRDSIVIRSRGFFSICVTTLALVVWMAIQVTRIWEINIPCFASFLLIQLVIATIAMIVFYRTWSIIHKLAMQQKAQHFFEKIAKQVCSDTSQELYAHQHKLGKRRYRCRRATELLLATRRFAS